jgi:hypothetical protein
MDGDEHEAGGRQAEQAESPRALGQIERSSARARSCAWREPGDGRRGDLHRLARPRHRAWHRRPAAGRIIEIYGPESSGKTTLALHVLAEAQKKGGVCAFVDAEHALDPIYARKLGVDLDDLLISQPDTGEQALEITIRWCAPARSTCW